MAIATDIDDGSKPEYDLPEPTKEGAVEVAEGEDGKPVANGHAGGEEEEFGEKTGWAPQFGWPVESVREAESLLDHSTWLESRLPDKFYGGRTDQVPLALDEHVADMAQTGTTTLASLYLLASPPG